MIPYHVSFAGQLIVNQIINKKIMEWKRIYFDQGAESQTKNESMKIRLKGIHESRRVWLNGKELSPKRSQKVHNHSPDGFNWGYGGSGPAQLALAICLELFGQSHGYQEIKWKYIGALPQTDFDVELEIVKP
jgi:hypothetical protein